MRVCRGVFDQVLNASAAASSACCACAAFAEPTVPTTSPVQFDPDQMKASIRRLVAHGPAVIRVAHYGAVTECERLAGDLVAQVDAMARIAREADGRPDRHARIAGELVRLYVERARAHGVADAERVVPEVLGNDIEINAQGLETWLERMRK